MSFPCPQHSSPDTFEAVLSLIFPSYFLQFLLFVISTEEDERLVLVLVLVRVAAPEPHVVTSLVLRVN